MASYGTTTRDVIDALNNLPNSYASKILKDIIVDTMKGVTETLSNKTIASPNITGNATVANSNTTGTATIAEANVTGNATIAEANVTGNAVVAEANITGNATIAESNTTGNAVIAEANVTGNAVVATLDVTGNAISLGSGVYNKMFDGLTAVEYEANGAIAHNSSLVHINANADAARAYTIDAPVAGEFLIIEQIDSDTNNRTVTLNAGTFDGANNVATFDAQYEALVLLGVSATRYQVLQNQGSVGLGT